MFGQIKFRAPAFCVCVLVFASYASATDPRFVRKASTDGEGMAYTSNRKVRIELREDWVQTADHTGPRLLSLLVLYEPGSGAFDWRVTDAANDESAPSYRMKEFNRGQAAYLKDGEFFDFRSEVGPLRLTVRRHHGHAMNLLDAEEQSFKEMSRTVDPRMAELTRTNIHEESLTALGWDFVLTRGSAVGGMIPAVTNVQWHQDSRRWIVTLRANWDEEVILDQSFNVVAPRRNH